MVGIVSGDAPGHGRGDRGLAERSRTRQRGRAGAAATRPADGASRREPGARRRGTCCSCVQQLEATFARLIFVAVGRRRSAATRCSTPARRRRCSTAAATPQQLALQCAKLFGLEDTVLFGRTLLVQANARSAVLQADALAAAARRRCRRERSLG